MKVREWHAKESDRRMRAFYFFAIAVGLWAWLGPKSRELSNFLIGFALLSAMFISMVVVLLRVARIQCPRCGKPLNVPTRWAFRLDDCQHCHLSFDEQMTAKAE
jgi:hypothetical protein